MNNTDKKLTPWINRDDNFNQALFWVEISDGVNYFTTSSNGEYWKLNEEIQRISDSTAVRGKDYMVNIRYNNRIVTFSYKDKQTNSLLFDEISCDISEFSITKIYVKSFLGNVTVSYNNCSETVYGADKYPNIISTSTPVLLNDGDDITIEIAVSNGNWYGFYEYDCWYKGVHACARSVEDLEMVLRDVLKGMNDAIKTELKTSGFQEKYNLLLPDEKRNLTIFNFYDQLNERELTDDELDSLKDRLYDENISILNNPEVELQHYQPTEDDIEELKDIINDNPNITQSELENIYVNHHTNDPNTKIYLINSESAKKEIETYDSDLSVSTMLCDVYEQLELMNSQMISTAEELIKLYEEKEKNSENL